MTEEERKELAAKVWELDADAYKASDRAAIETGLAGLNAITLFNGGAIVALLAFIGQIWTGGKGLATIQELLRAAHPFVYGVVVSLLTYLFAYLYQSATTANIRIPIQKHLYGRADAQTWVPQATRVFSILMIVCAVGAIVCFAWGARSVAHVFLDMNLK